MFCRVLYTGFFLTLSAFFPQVIWAGEQGEGLPAARFAEIKSPLELSAVNAPRPGSSDFSLSLWMKSDELSGQLPGDLISQYDPGKRKGFHLTLKCNTGTTTSQANWRQLQFGLDNNQETQWVDCGRPGKAILAFSMASHEGKLYAGTCEPGKNEAGRVYQYQAPGNWLDCGAPDKSNSVSALVVFQNQLFAGTAKYRLAGSRLKESENSNLGGAVFRFESPNRWIPCGQLPATEAIGGFVVFKGKLYTSSLYKPAGFFRYEKENEWTSLPVPMGVDPASGLYTPKRVEALTVFQNYLYASSYDGGHVYRFDGQKWEDCGRLGDNTQTYSFAQLEGKLFVGTWPSGKVYRFDGIGKWADTGRLGQELEVMGMVVHNGRFLAGSLPLAEVYSLEKTGWQRLVRLDHTPDVTYRRAWTMAEHDGKVFCSTLPSGKVFSFAAGCQTSWEHSLDSKWHHLAAVKSGGRLMIYLDGKFVSQSRSFDPALYDLDSSAPLQVGTGRNGPFNGQLAEARYYLRAITSKEIANLAGERPSQAK